MWPLVLLQNRLLGAALLGALVVGGVWGWGEYRYRQGWSEGRAAMVAERLRDEAETRGRMDDADVDRGDAADTDRWLRDRAGGR